ncbi:hypothetical protein MOQ_002968 [Trypanosoma cruzi marinkellei]|uniref:Uncharacterized protein n=1 Tax=Trypanosoma cruzi marinkellei TaxID=85056 RepID=K2N5B3_TRYCR|nr:hypothetical protein MOQ_002968 [Trypanosoma cruzi marinkellei]
MMSRRWKRRRRLLFIAALYVVLSLTFGSLYFLIVTDSGHGEAEVRTPQFHAADNLLSKVVPTENTNNLTQVFSLNEIVCDAFYRLRSVADGRWLGHSSEGLYGGVLDKTLGVACGETEGTYAIQAWSSLFLSAHRDGSVGMDRPKARSAEMWSFKFVRGEGTVALWSTSRRRFVRISGDRLICDAKTLQRATHWMLYIEPQKTCHSPGTGEDWGTVSRACWKVQLPAPKKGVEPKVVFFGTLKPLKSLVPNESDMHDQVVIANRTLFNWALIEGVQPVVFSDNPLDHELIERVNLDLAARTLGQRIDVIKDFEIHEKFGLPTYRGLFSRVLAGYPDAHYFMYSNMDILYTRSALETIRAVQRHYSAMEGSERNFTVKGWFAVGRRTNVEFPLRWSLGTNWEKAVEGVCGATGKLFQSFSEDYFAMSRNMFDWKSIPDFVVGGTAFDNWLTTQAVMLARAGLALTVEATLTLAAIHQNHGENLKASHMHPKSRYNNKLAHRSGGWALGHTTDAPFLTVRHFGGEVLVVGKNSPLLH